MKHLRSLFVLLALFITNAIQGQIITTIAGGVTGHGGYWGDGGPATAAEFNGIYNIDVDGAGNTYIADGVRIRKVNAVTGIVTTVAGDGIIGYSPDGTAATAAHFRPTLGICLDTSGNLYISDGNYKIRRVNVTTGLLTTVAGNGIFGYSGDGGSATAASIVGGMICSDNFGNLYIADGRRIRKVDAAGIITTIAGTGLPGPTGEGVPATATNILPAGIATDAIGNVYAADTLGSIRKIAVSTGLITRVAGTGDNVLSPYSGDGIAATACHIGPFGITVDPLGNIYVGDLTNSRVEYIDNTGIISTIAGNGIPGFSGDGGPATAAKFSYIEDLKIDKCGNVYIADFNNKRLRKVTYHISCDPSLSYQTTLQPTAISIYPNPTNNLLHIDNLQTESTYRLLNIVGSLMQQGNLKAGNNNISVQILPAGMYMLEIVEGESNPPLLNSYGGQRRTYKIIKE